MKHFPLIAAAILVVAWSCGAVAITTVTQGAALRMAMLQALVK
jgi:hypothetical protein